MGCARARAQRRLDVVELRPSRRDAAAVRAIPSRAPFLAARRSHVRPRRVSRGRARRARRTCWRRWRAVGASSVVRSATSSSNGRRTTTPRSTPCSRGSRRNTARPASGIVSISRGSSTSSARWRRPRAMASPGCSAPCAPASSSSPCTSVCSDTIGSSGGSPRTTRTFGSYSAGLILLLDLVAEAAARGLTLVDLGRGEHHYKLRVANGAYDVAEGVVPAAR